MVDLHITGTTAVFGIVADPTDHVRAPMVFNPRFAAHGRDAVMVPCHVTPEDLPAFMAGLRAQRNFYGPAVTIPHKMAIMALCDEIGEQGRLVGAVNTIRIDADRRVHGENFDGQGFVAGLRAEGFEVTGKAVFQTGAGGAGRAIAFGVAAAGAARLTIHNRTRAKAEELAAAVTAAYPACRAEAVDGPAGDTEVAVNTTSLGLHAGDPLPIDLAALAPAAVVAEIIMIPEETDLLVAARAAGHPVHYCRHMLDHQIRLIADYIGA